MLKRTSLSLLAALCLALASEARAMISVGSAETEGSATDVEVVGDLAYVGNLGFRGSPLQIFDISDPASPAEVGRLPDQDEFFSVRNVEVVGRLAYLTDARSGNPRLRIVDVSNPEIPVEIGILRLEARPQDVEVVGGFAYLAGEQAALRIIDVSDPSRPTETSTLDPGGYSNGLAVAGTHVYLTSLRAFRVIDVSDPAQPREIGMLDSPVLLRDVELVGTLAYVVTDAGVQVIDVSNPARPERVVMIETPFGAGDVEVVDDIAYVIDNIAGLLLFDVSDPEKPVALGAFDTPGLAYAIAVADPFAYIADGGSGLQVVDISNRDYPRVLGSLSVEDAGSDPWVGFARDVEVVGEFAYLTTGGIESGLRVVRIGDPARPFEVARVQFRVDDFASAGDVEVEGKYAYLTEGARSGSSLRVLDISTPSKPFEVGSLDGVGGKLEVSDGLVYVAGFGDGLRIIDVSKPFQPREISSIQLPTRATDVEVVGQLAYVSFSFSPIKGLWVVDVSDPYRPMKIGEIDLPRRVFSLEIEGAFAYGAFQGLQKIDVSDPAMPELTTIFDPDLNGSSELAVQSSRALFSQRIPGGSFPGSHRGTTVAVLDVTKPEQGVLGSIHLPGPSLEGIDVVGGLAYVANSTEGLQIVDFGPEYFAERDVEIDIEPRKEKNIIDPLKPRLLPVALLGSRAFDVRDVDVASLAFGAMGAKPLFPLTHPLVFHFSHRDVNGDGAKDLVPYFDSRDAGIAFGDTEACLTGETRDGTPFEGCDAIETLHGCGAGFKISLLIPGILLLRAKRRRGSIRS